MIRRIAAFALLFAFASASVAEARRCPNIMFVLDKSGSMNQDPAGGGKPPLKWQLVLTQLTQTLISFADRVPFGLTVFSSFGGGAACYNDTQLLNDCKSEQGQDLINKLNMIKWDGNTNTAEAIRRAYTDSMALKDAARENFLVLITDGNPNCGSPEPTNTVNEIKKAAALNPPLKTYVIGFDAVQGGLGVNASALNEMAVAGQTPRVAAGCNPKDPNSPIPCYYSASDGPKFQAAVNEIIGGLAGNSAIAACDDTCFSLGCPEGQVCVIPSIGAKPVCRPDSCASVTCDEGTYCKDGHCLKPCPTCATDEICYQETCIPNKCPQALRDQCAGNMFVCDPSTPDGDPGKCAANLCAANNKTCPLPTFCDPLTGYCADDACRLINCPALSTCYGGYCMSDPPEDNGDMASPPDLAFDNKALDFSATVGMDTARDDGGCSVGGGARRGGSTAPLLAGVVLGLFLFARRRRA